MRWEEFAYKTDLQSFNFQLLEVRLRISCILLVSHFSFLIYFWGAVMWDCILLVFIVAVSIFFHFPLHKIGLCPFQPCLAPGPSPSDLMRATESNHSWACRLHSLGFPIDLLCVGVGPWEPPAGEKMARRGKGHYFCSLLDFKLQIRSDYIYSRL
jgi:hypothetical protein